MGARRWGRTWKHAAFAALSCTIALLTSVPARADAVTFHGSAAGTSLNSWVVDLAPTASGNGYWLVGGDGGIFSFGDARFHGSTGGMRLNQPIVGMAATPSGAGYWTVASDGGIFSFGDARFHGSTGGIPLNQPIVGMASTPSGNGYWLVARDGGMFSFGDAQFYGSTGGMALVSPITGMTPTPSGRGYWLVAEDGGVFSFGDARFLGSLGGVAIDFPVVDIASTPTGRGYWVVTLRGGVTGFGDAGVQTSMSGRRPSSYVSGIGATRDGYWLGGLDGAVYTYGPEARFVDSLRPAPPTATKEQQLARDIFDRLNTERRLRGLDPLIWDDRLAGLASDWSRTLMSSPFQHRDLNPVLGWPGYDRYRSLGENIYSGTGSYAATGQAHVSWMNSESHRKNVLNTGFDTVGVGVACSGGKLVATVNFGGWAGYNDRGLDQTTEAANPIAASSPGARC